MGCLWTGFHEANCTVNKAIYLFLPFCKLLLTTELWAQSCITQSPLTCFLFFFPDDCDELCQHGGRCVQGQCICPLNYEGERCEKGILSASAAKSLVTHKQHFANHKYKMLAVTWAGHVDGKYKRGKTWAGKPRYCSRDSCFAFWLAENGTARDVLEPITWCSIARKCQAFHDRRDKRQVCFFKFTLTSM